MKTIGLFALVGFAAGCGSGDGDPGPGPSAPDAVTISTFPAPPPRFSPQSATLAVGGTVTFHNGSPVVGGGEHNVKSATNVWPQTTLQSGESFEVTLSTAGQYPFECTIHPGMTGVISVQ